MEDADATRGLREHRTPEADGMTEREAAQTAAAAETGAKTAPGMPEAFEVPAALASPVLWRPTEAEKPRIDRAEMLRYLGYTGQELEPELAARIERTVLELEGSVTPRGVRRVFPVDARGLDASGRPCIRLVGTCVELRGRDIYRHLKDAACCALLAVTLGMDCERRLRVLGDRSPLEGAVYDAAASAYAEAAIETMDRQTKADAAHAGLAANWRFSCGYGDCPLGAQPRILAALDATRRLGLTTTPTNLLLPSKSVTAMMGLFDGEARSADAPARCSLCRLRGDCAFRARGTTC